MWAVAFQFVSPYPSNTRFARAVSYPTRHVHPHDRPPLPFSSALRFSRLDFSAYYLSLDLFFDAATDLVPSPFLKGDVFGQSVRIAYVLERISLAS